MRYDTPEVTEQSKAAASFHLQLLKMGKKEIIPEAVRYQSEIDVAYDIVMGHMVAEMTTYVLAEKVMDKSIRVPYHIEDWYHASWWQHTKENFRLLRWVSRKFGRPPRLVKVEWDGFRTVDLSGYMTFPRAKAYPVELGQPVIITTADVAR